MQTMSSFTCWSIAILVLTAALIDLRSRRIPNWLVFPFLAAGMVSSTIDGGARGALQSLEGISLAVIIMGIPVGLKGLGMGDLKLCAAVGAWAGPWRLMTALTATGIAGGLVAVIWIARRRLIARSLDRTGDLLVSLWRKGPRAHATIHLDNPLANKLPYAPAIAIGTLFSLLSS